MARREAGEIELAPPTWMTLWRLSGAASVEEAAAQSRGREPERFETHIVFGDDRMVAVWAGDAAYDSGDLDTPGPRHRLWMRKDGWHFESSDQGPGP